MRYHVVGAFEKLYIVLDILQLKLLLCFLEQTQLRLNFVKANSLHVNFNNFMFCSLQAAINLVGLAIEHFLGQFQVMGKPLELTAPELNRFIISDDIRVQFFHLSDKSVTLIAISILQLADLH